MKRQSWLCAAATLLAASVASADPPSTAPDESALGEILVTGTQAAEKLPRIAILPSLSPDYEDVIVRGVVRHDFELTGLFDVISDDKAPAGMYGFEDAVDVDAWRKLGAEAIVKVAARKAATADQIEVFGLAYLMSSGKKPVFEKKLTVKKTDARVTAHRITDALLGALTGRPGGFASELTFSGRWGKNRRIFRMDADGNGLVPFTDPKDTAIAPAFGPGNKIFYLVSHEYSPFALFDYANQKNEAVSVPFKTSLYGVSLSRDGKQLALAVADAGKSAIFVGAADGSNMKSVSTTELATRPVFSPTGKLSWIGGAAKQGTQRVWLDGKPVSPPGSYRRWPNVLRHRRRHVTHRVCGGGRWRKPRSGDGRREGARDWPPDSGSRLQHPPSVQPRRSLAGLLLDARQCAWAFMSCRSRASATQSISTQLGEGLSWAALP